MSRKVLFDIAFTLAITALVGAAVFEARGWEIKARLFPWAIGIPLLALLLVQLALRYRSLVTVGAGGTVAHQEAEHEVPPEIFRRRAYSMIGWLVAFVAFIFVLGFPIGGTLASLIYFRYTSREGWRMTAYMVLGTFAFFWIMAFPLTTPFNEGYFFEFIGFKPFEWLGYQQNMLSTAFEELLGIGGGR
ncbi:MAG: hypothetical protein HY690_10745 [Chloroflexi bacterium]|nr:hypothetical protein [Chloroflexota bacterium]